MSQFAPEGKRVSVIVPVYNAQNFVAETLESILAQTYEDWECILVNDCSSDASPEILERFAERDPRFRLCNNAVNLGPAGSRNAGLAIAQGRFICFLDSDDVWLPQKLSAQIEWMLSRQCGMSYSGYLVIDEWGTSSGAYLPSRRHSGYKDLLRSCDIGCLTVMLDRNLFPEIHFPVDAPFGREDYRLWLLLLKGGGQAFNTKQMYACYRVRRSSTSRNKVKMAINQWRVYRTALGLGRIVSVGLLLQYVILGLIKNSFHYRKRIGPRPAS